jgi:glycosyltransferase involved in cell wall biosynthesis
VKKYGLQDKVIFTNLIKKRDDIIDYYLRADLFLFPSVYDTDGLVKSEAAICDTPSVMIEGSIATIGLNDREDVYLAKEDAVGFADKICEIIQDKENYEFVKKNAKVKLYRTWEQNAVVATKMYNQAIENKKNTKKI